MQYMIAQSPIYNLGMANNSIIQSAINDSGALVEPNVIPVADYKFHVNGSKTIWVDFVEGYPIIRIMVAPSALY